MTVMQQEKGGVAEVVGLTKVQPSPHKIALLLLLFTLSGVSNVFSAYQDKNGIGTSCLFIAFVCLLHGLHYIALHCIALHMQCALIQTVVLIKTIKRWCSCRPLMMNLIK